MGWRCWCRPCSSSCKSWTTSGSNKWKITCGRAWRLSAVSTRSSTSVWTASSAPPTASIPNRSAATPTAQAAGFWNASKGFQHPNNANWNTWTPFGAGTGPRFSRLWRFGRFLFRTFEEFGPRTGQMFQLAPHWLMRWRIPLEWRQAVVVAAKWDAIRCVNLNEIWRCNLTGRAAGDRAVQVRLPSSGRRAVWGPEHAQR